VRKGGKGNSSQAKTNPFQRNNKTTDTTSRPPPLQTQADSSYKAPTWAQMRDCKPAAKEMKERQRQQQQKQGRGRQERKTTAKAMYYNQRNTG
jgi:hypothetical protein